MTRILFQTCTRRTRSTVGTLLLLGALGRQPATADDASPALGSTQDDPGVTLESYADASPELRALLAEIEAAGASEVDVAPFDPREIFEFQGRLVTAGELGRAPAEEESSPKTLEVLDLIRSAGSYGEAKLLTREAFGGRSLERPVPPELSEDPQDPNWVFQDDNPTYPELVADALRIRRAARDRALDRLSDRAFDRYARIEQKRLLQQRRELAAFTGRPFDAREDLYVAVLNSDEIWRRKKPSDYVPGRVQREGPGGPRDDVASYPELDAVDNTGAAAESTKEVFGGDTRELRSEFNGFDMQSSAWQPKGAIIPESNSSNGDPINVDCTGVKIRERLVVTAGHCLFDNGSWNTNRKWIPGADGIADVMGTTNDPSPNGYKSSFRRLVRSQWFDHEWANYDFGIFVLHDNSSSCSLFWHGWWNKGGLLNDTIHLYGYPGELQNCAASPLVSDDCYGSIYGAGGTITYAGAYRVRYSIDTQPGQSGTGFYEIVNGVRYVVGTHRGQYNGSRNDGVRISNGVRNIINDAKADYPPNAC